ncbi:MAG: hypothetical protein JXN64_09655 [Spirochaetes bacterium]|nr:hypothetical protein [Spirochaetota bacterium]
MYYENAYNWMRFRIEEIPATDSDMEAGFAAFDAASNEGLLYGAGYYSAGDSISDINSSDASKVNSFMYNPELVANTMWQGAVGDMNNAVTLTGTATGTNMLDFGPDVGGGGSGLAIPQSDITLAEAAGTYFLLCYENDQTSHSNSVNPMKLVISATGQQIKIFQYSDRTDTGIPGFSDSLTAVADLTADESPGGTTAIKDQYADISGNADASSAVVRNAHYCLGSFVAQETDQVINIIFDPSGAFCGFTMFDTTGNDIIRFGFGVKDAGYVNQ